MSEIEDIRASIAELRPYVGVTQGSAGPLPGDPKLAAVVAVLEKITDRLEKLG